nr:MAG TPA: hypothetical protein [Caudoviricetes sp.]
MPAAVHGKQLTFAPYQPLKIKRMSKCYLSAPLPF